MAQLRGAGEAGAGPAHVFAGNQEAVITAFAYQGQQLLFGELQPPSGIGRRWHW